MSEKKIDEKMLKCKKYLLAYSLPERKQRKLFGPFYIARIFLFRYDACQRKVSAPFGAIWDAESKSSSSPNGGRYGKTLYKVFILVNIGHIGTITFIITAFLLT